MDQYATAPFPSRRTHDRPRDHNSSKGLSCVMSHKTGQTQGVIQVTPHTQRLHQHHSRAVKDRPVRRTQDHSYDDALLDDYLDNHETSSDKRLYTTKPHGDELWLDVKQDNNGHGSALKQQQIRVTTTALSSPCQEVVGEPRPLPNNHIIYSDNPCYHEEEAPQCLPLSAKTDTNTTHDTKTKLTTAFEETSYFLGGLINHPTSSTKHFTILRHSHGLVYYKGPETSIAFTIFADRPIPRTRRLWLQVKGWTGNMGMRAKALMRANDSWINVTPELEAHAEQIAQNDERAWQRDIRKFVEKAPKNVQKHVVRETVIVRIPCEAVDGYFRLNLTAGDDKNVLCPSPVFRVASTSLSASSVKGASLKTLPIELGVRAAQAAASTVAKNALTHAVGKATQHASRLAPVQKYGGRAQDLYNKAGIPEQLATVDERYQVRRVQSYDTLGGSHTEMYQSLSRTPTVGVVAGPEPPFPVKLKDVVSAGTGHAFRETGMPTANMDTIPPDLIALLHPGVYFGWAAVKSTTKTDHSADQWYQAIITITHYRQGVARATVAQRKVARAYLLHDFAAHEHFAGKTMKLVIMGWLRPLIPDPIKEVLLVEAVRDIEVTQASLSREAWGPEETVRRIRSAKSQQSLADRFVDARTYGQRQLDKVSIHKLGIRAENTEVYDRGLYGRGGMFIKRDG